MKSKNLKTQLKNTLAMLAVFTLTAFFAQNSKAQFTITDFSNYTFYTNPTGSNDLHYHYGWTRSDTTVFISGSNMVAEPDNSNPRWFQTVAMNLSGADLVSFDHRLSNVGGQGTKTLVVSLIDTLNTSIVKNVDTITYTNASSNNSANQLLFLTDSGTYYIRFTFTHTGSLRSSPQFQISGFSTTGKPIHLPVNFVSFEANQTGSNVNLKWITASETNNSHFDIERSQDTENWITLGQVPGVGNSEELNSYEYSDFITLNEITYYRLKQVDYNGEMDYSDIRQVIPVTTTPDKDKITVYPNPANNFIKIDIKEEVDFVKTEIRSLDGRVYASNEFQNQTQPNVSISHLTPGMYYLHIQMGNQLVVRSFVKQ